MSIQDLRNLLTEFRETPASRGLDLRLSLQTVVLTRLNALGWTQKQLADATGMKEPFITRVVHGDSNCTFDVAGRILHALGVRAKIVEALPEVSREVVGVSAERSTSSRVSFTAHESSNGTEKANRFVESHTSPAGGVAYHCFQRTA